jgi:hypothetical protein
VIPRSLQISLGVLLAAVFALGFYALHLKREAEQNQQAHYGPVAPPVAGPTGPVTLYLANDADGQLHPVQQTIALPVDRSKRAREVLHALCAVYKDESSTHRLGPGADINDVYLVNDTLAVVDANKAFADAHPSGILVEDLTLMSMAQSLAANVPGITRMKLIVDGKERETLAGHVDLKGIFEVAPQAANGIAVAPGATGSSPQKSVNQ